MIPMFLLAHNVNLFVDYEDGMLFISSYFSYGKPCKSCKFSILDKEDTLLKEGFLNEDGNFEERFENIDLTIKIDAGAGHSAMQKIFSKKNSVIKTEMSQEDSKLEELLNENRRLKKQILLLEKKLDYFEVFKLLFGLFLIWAIFQILRRVKR